METVWGCSVASFIIRSTVQSKDNLTHTHTLSAELSLYELHRKPHEMVVDNSAIAVSPRALHSELMCPICLDLMRNAQTTKEVLYTQLYCVQHCLQGLLFKYS